MQDLTQPSDLDAAFTAIDSLIRCFCPVSNLDTRDNPRAWALFAGLEEAGYAPQDITVDSMLLALGSAWDNAEDSLRNGIDEDECIEAAVALTKHFRAL